MIWIIANPTAGGKKTRAYAELAASHLIQNRVNVELYFTEQSGDVKRITAEAKKTNVDIVAICGGDGTVHEALSELDGSDTTLAILPHGSGNDLARALNIPIRLKNTADYIINGRRALVDLGRWDNGVFSTVAAIGLDAVVNHSIAVRGIQNKTKSTYFFEAIRQLPKYQPTQVKLRGDFGNIQCVTTLIACANSNSYGGGLKIAPNAQTNDGLFDVCIVSAINLPQALHLFIKLLNGTHNENPAVRIERTSFLEIEPEDKRQFFYADGEFGDYLPARFEIAPQAIKVLLPNT